MHSDRLPGSPAGGALPLTFIAAHAQARGRARAPRALTRRLSEPLRPRRGGSDSLLHQVPAQG